MGSPKKIQKLIFRLSGVAFFMLIWINSANALDYKLSNDVDLVINPAFTYGAGWRVADQDRNLLKNVNGDDGNRNFEKWDMINNRFNLTVDVELNKDGYGIFFRPRAYYDFVYDGKTSNDSPTTFNNGPLYGGPVRDNRHFDKKTQDVHRDKVEVLDLFGYKDFYVGDHPVTIRVGRQVVNWGESVFIPNGVGSAMGPVDATAANTPGTELKEIYLPVGQVYGQFGISKNINLVGFYQWEWEKTRLNEAGSFFSTSDILDDAGRRILIPVDLENGLAATVDRIRDDDADDSGQFGVALRYVAESWNYTEFGFYFINYHDKGPQLVSQAGGGHASRDWGVDSLNLLDNGSYYLKYVEDIKLYGFSMGTTIGERGDINIGCDITYRDDLPIGVRTPTTLLGTGYTLGNALQAQLSAIWAGGPNLIFDKCSVTAEAGINTVGGYGGAELINDRSAWGGTMKVSEGWLDLMPNTDVDVYATYKWNPNGRSSLAGTFTEGADSITLGVDIYYAIENVIKLTYTNYINSFRSNSMTDHDNVSLSLKRTF